MMMKRYIYIAIAFVLLSVMCVFSPKPAHAVCTSPSGTDGAIVYNSSQKIFQYCKGTAWSPMNIQPGTGSGGCTSPTLAEGIMVYNTDQRLLQGCAGNVHRPFGEAGGGLDWIKIATGPDGYHTCAIKSDFTLWCWGNNTNGQIGDNTNGNVRASPTQVNGGGQWKTVSVGNAHTCGIKADNTLWCWGLNTNGRLGDSSTTARTVPTAVSGGGAWLSVAAGGVHTCAIRNDYSLLCWGNGANGKRGDNSTTATQSTPVEVNGGGSWRMVTTGTSHTCAINGASALYCWGLGSNGQRGDSSTTATRQTPLLIDSGQSYKYIAAGNAHTCGIRADDSLRCWGENATYGQVGDGTYTQRTVPTAISGGGTWRSVSAGLSHSCGVRTNGTLRCWGGGYQAQGGINAPDYLGNVPTAPYGGGTWSQVVAGALHSCAIRSDGKISCWGDDDTYVQSGRGNSYELVPKAIVDGSAWKNESNGDYHTCRIKSDDTLWCAGWNDLGKLGDNTTTNRDNPVAVNGGGTWKSVAGGWEHSCGIRSDDTMRCWGRNSSGQLGDNTATPRLVPTAVNGGGTWKMISVGDAHSCGIRSDDTMRCWGTNYYNQLGDGTGTDRLIPTAISGGGTWKSVAAGANYTCAINSADALFCWGANGSGQLGDNTTTQRSVPTAINGGGTWKFIAAGDAHACGIKTDDTLWCWGDGNYGQVGDNNIIDRTIPVAVSGGGTWKSVEGGSFHTCGIKSDDTGWCWGRNYDGRVGDGTTTDRLVPTAISGGGTWIDLDPSARITCGLKTGGLSYCWGNPHIHYAPAPSATGCVSPTGKEADIRYNSTTNVLQYCDGVGWAGINDGGNVPYIATASAISGLIHHWPMDDNPASNTLVDVVGGQNCTITNGTWTSYTDGTDISMTLVNGRSDCGTISALSGVSQFTFVGWFKRNAPGYRLAMGAIDDPTSSGISLAVWDDASNYGVVSASGGGWDEASYGLNDLVWHRFALVYDGSLTGNANRLKMYVDGLPVTLSFSGTIPAVTPTLGTFRLGDYDSGTFGDGAMDDIRIYNRALTAAEINALALP